MHFMFSSSLFIAELMESTSVGHTYMSSEQRLALSEAHLLDITLKEVNEAARELCEHVSHRNPEVGILPSAIITCAPYVEQSGMCY